MTPDFRSATFLKQHAQSILDFYLPQCVDESGGFYHHFLDDGTVYEREIRHLVSSARFVFNFALASQHFERDTYLNLTRHGLQFIETVHHNPQSDGFAWLLEGGKPSDDTNHCYGFAFLLLAYATALKAGIVKARAGVDQIFGLMEQYFWDNDFGLYRDEMSGDWQTLSPYRGQNANMHSCEALLAAYEATGEAIFLQRAYTVAKNITIRQAGLANGRIWEHYTPNWQIDWEYNKDNPRHRFRPWGFQPGHQTEWAKLLLILERHRPEAWLLPRAIELFNWTTAHSWDADNGGFYYSLHPDGWASDPDKYCWVQNEALATAALLAIGTQDATYWQWYDKIWAYCWDHFVDHDYSGWFRILTRDNKKYSNKKSPAGKVDYHAFGACIEVINAIQ